MPLIVTCRQSKSQPKLKQPTEEEIAMVTAEMNPKELEILAKKPSILDPPKEADIKQTELGTGDPSKMATISTHLPEK
jgi:hypothetical protein